jgi:hypothetical protein
VIQIQNNNTTRDLSWPYEDYSPLSVWFKSYLQINVGSGLGLGQYNEGSGWSFVRERRCGFLSIGGTDYNNLFGINFCGNIEHFNGLNWHQIATIDAHLYSVAVKGNIAVAVGEMTSTLEAVIIFIKRI